MSDHDHHENESKNPLANAVGMFFFILIPVGLIVMLGIVGSAFIQGGGYKEAPPEPKLTTAPPAPKPPKVTPDQPDPATPSPTDPGAAPAKPEVADQPDGAEPSPEQMKLGQTTFALCAACHGPDGKGVQTGPQKMAPSFVGSKLLLGDPEAPLAAVLKGIHRPPTSPYIGQMMALGAGLDDEKVAAVVTYARNSFGNKAPAVTTEQAAAVRAKYATVNAPMGLPRADLEKVAAGE